MPAWSDNIRKDGSGWALSLLLHVLLLLAALWYLAHRAALPPNRFQTLPVELVIGGTLGQQASIRPAARLEVAKPHPESAPVPEGTSPHGTREPEDALSARLRALAQLKTPDSVLHNADNDAAPGGSGGGEGEGNYALKDFLRAQILRHWLPDLSLPGARNMPVEIRLHLLRSGVIEDVVILDRARYQSDAVFRNMALSARDATLLTSPIQWPSGQAQKSQVLTINLDPKAVLR